MTDNGTIDISELLKEEGWKKLVADLNDKENNQLISIIKSMNHLEDGITKYRQGIADKENYETKSKFRRRMVKKTKSKKRF